MGHEVSKIVESEIKQSSVINGGDSSKELSVYDQIVSEDELYDHLRSQFESFLENDMFLNYSKFSFATLMLFKTLKVPKYDIKNWNPSLFKRWNDQYGKYCSTQFDIYGSHEMASGDLLDWWMDKRKELICIMDTVLEPMEDLRPTEPIPEHSTIWTIDDYQFESYDLYYNEPEHGHAKRKFVDEYQFEDYDLYYNKPAPENARRTFVDIVKKDVHLFARLQSGPKQIVLNPRPKDDFEVLKSKPLQRPIVKLKNCYYYSDSSKGHVINMKANINELKFRFGEVYDPDYLEGVFKGNDFNLDETIRLCTIQIARNRLEKLRQDGFITEVIIFIDVWIDFIF